MLLNQRQCVKVANTFVKLRRPFEIGKDKCDVANPEASRPFDLLRTEQIPKDLCRKEPLCGQVRFDIEDRTTVRSGVRKFDDCDENSVIGAIFGNKPNAS